MTAPHLNGEDQMLAAEHALGVLHGAELARAQQLLLQSPEFAQAVDEWRVSLAPIAEEIPERAPGPHVWGAIDQALTSAADEDGTLVELRHKLRIWKGVSFVAVAAAAAALVFAVLPSNPNLVSPKPPEAVLVANIASEETGTSVSAAYNPADRTLRVSPALLERAEGHEHELWIIPPGGQPVPVGMIAAGQSQRLPVQAEIAPHFNRRSTLAISVEPVGGSPTGKPTGPVIAAGELTVI